MKTVPEKPDLNKLVENAEVLATEPAPEKPGSEAPDKEKPEASATEPSPSTKPVNKNPGHYGPIILFNILLLPVLVVVINALINAPGTDISIIINIIWWIAFAGGNIILFDRRKIKIMLDELKENDRIE